MIQVQTSCKKTHTPANKLHQGTAAPKVVTSGSPSPLLQSPELRLYSYCPATEPQARAHRPSRPATVSHPQTVCRSRGPGEGRLARLWEVEGIPFLTEGRQVGCKVEKREKGVGRRNRPGQGTDASSAPVALTQKPGGESEGQNPCTRPVSSKNWGPGLALLCSWPSLLRRKGRGEAVGEWAALQAVSQLHVEHPGTPAMLGPSGACPVGEQTFINRITPLTIVKCCG